MTTPDDNTQSSCWTGFAASIPGGGHIRHGIPCQDASAVMTSPRPAVIVCDGRGSASLSHLGAQGAVEAFRFQMSILEPFLVSILDGEGKNQEQWIKFCRIMYRTLMQVKYDLAEKHNKAEKEFDCTVAFAIAGGKHIGCFQVGDGSIVLRQNGICKTVFAPEKGEFANQTHFLRPGGEEGMKFQYALLDAEVNSGIAVTSDGPEHLMFHLADMTPGKIFDSLLDDLRKEELCRQDLMDYLTRREWADDPRGSDDRSLALLARLENESGAVPEPEVKMMAESEPVTRIALAVKQAPSTAVPLETESEAEVRNTIQTEAEKPKKNVTFYLLLAAAVVSSFGIGLLIETTCLLTQKETIMRQQQEIQALKQQLVQEKRQPEMGSSRATFPSPKTSRPIIEKNGPKVPLAPHSRPVSPVHETEQSNAFSAEKNIRPGTAENPEIEIIHKENSPHGAGEGSVGD